MSAAIKTLQEALGVKADGIRGPVTDGAILRAADAGRLIAIEPPDLVVIKPPEAADSLPDAGRAKLSGVHAALQSIVMVAASRSEVPFTCIEGLRSITRQRELVARGASKTMSSRHLTGHAADLWPLDPATGKPLPSGSKAAEARLWADLRKIAAVMKTVAAEKGIAIEWGGDWGWDAPHFQLPRSSYPA